MLQVAVFQDYRLLRRHRGEHRAQWIFDSPEIYRNRAHTQLVEILGVLRAEVRELGSELTRRLCRPADFWERAAYVPDSGALLKIFWLQPLVANFASPSYHVAGKFFGGGSGLLARVVRQ
jgi:hypothetical protein